MLQRPWGSVEGLKTPRCPLHGDPAISAALGRSERVPLWIEVVDFPET